MIDEPITPRTTARLIAMDRVKEKKIWKPNSYVIGALNWEKKCLKSTINA
jgi:hypothetical protein